MDNRMTLGNNKLSSLATRYQADEPGGDLILANSLDAYSPGSVSLGSQMNKLFRNRLQRSFEQLVWSVRSQIDGDQTWLLAGNDGYQGLTPVRGIGRITMRTNLSMPLQYLNWLRQANRIDINHYDVSVILGQISLPFSEIFFLQGTGENHCQIHGVDHQWHVEITLKEIIGQLQHPFLIRISDEFYINAMHLYGINASEFFLRCRSRLLTIFYAPHVGNSFGNRRITLWRSKHLEALFQHMDPRQKAFFSNVESIILENLESPRFSMDLIAEKLGMCVRSLQRKFSRELGMAPQKYMLEIRLLYARELKVRDPGIAMHELAKKVNYLDERYFEKLLMKRFPTAFQN